MTAVRFVAFTLLFVLIGCAPKVPTVTVDVVDTSLSIKPRAEADALRAIRGQISSLGRGDTLILIPITGNAENDMEGRILSLHAPTTREPYDAGIRRFRKDAVRKFTAWSSSAHADPDRTDILGALNVASQVIASLPRDSRSRLIVLSDFLEDAPPYNFTDSPYLETAKRARHLGAQLRAKQHPSFPDIPICLGQLESREYQSLSPQRIEAVQTFWTTYLRNHGHAPELRIDGTGTLAGCFSTEDAITSGRGGGSS